MGYSPWGLEELDPTEHINVILSIHIQIPPVALVMARA